MFTVEIGGRPIAIMNADEAQARDVFESEEFKQDLRAMTSNGAPLCDGRASLTVRPAFQHEVEVFETPNPNADDFDDEARDDGVFVTFLVPIDHDHEEASAVSPSQHRP